MADLRELVELYVRELAGPRSGDAWHSLVEAGSDALPYILAAYHSVRNVRDKVSLISVIGQYRTPEATPFLETSLKNKEPDIWKAALDALVLLNDDVVLNILINARADASAEKLSWIEEALEQIRSITQGLKPAKSFPDFPPTEVGGSAALRLPNSSASSIDASHPTPYRGRIAPSPTGYLHLGHARTFWTAYQRALAANGILVLRDEDLDRQRCRPEFVQAMYEDLRWLGIRWQEGPDVGGPFGPYRQSERYPRYLAAWHKLARQGYIYPCACSRKDLAGALQAPHEGPQELPDDEPLYPGTCRNRIVECASFDKPDGISWRFRVPDGEVIAFHDLRLGAQCFTAGSDFGDFLVWRRDGVPSYQLAVVADDAAMEITEVVRGADLLKSTARQILLARALGLSLPAYYHCELMTDERGVRLAKRHDALSLRTLRGEGKSSESLRASWSCTRAGL